METHKVILWDLDGTLTDSKEGIIRSVQYALGKMGVTQPSMEELVNFIGPPLQDSFERELHFTPQQCAQAVSLYREYFSVRGLYENRVYPGIPELLHDLVRAGKILVLATSKPTPYSVQILTHFHLEHFFNQIVGSNLDGSRSKKADVIAHAMQQYPSLNPLSCVMIGDRKEDVAGAHSNGVDSIAVSYGYGSSEELELAHPTFLANSVPDIRKILIA